MNTWPESRRNLPMNLRESSRAPEPGQRWGFFGGAFDPLHYGHLTLARELAQLGQLDGVLWVPTFVPPHRSSATLSSYEDRRAMVRLGIFEDDSFVPSDIECELPQPNYTLNTVRQLKKGYPEVAWFLMLGADQVLKLETWHQPEAVLAETVVLVGGRPHYDVPRRFLEHPRIRLLPTSLIDLTATAIRDTVRAGTTVEELERLVPLPVAQYILDKGLYR